MIRVKKLEYFDVKELEDLVKRCFPNDSRLDESEYQSKSNNKHLYVAIDTETKKMVGFGILSVNPGFRIARLTLGGVDPKYRGQGIHKKLIKARLKKAKELKLKSVSTYTMSYNYKSANNLIACGFRIYIPKNDPNPSKYLNLRYLLEK